ncbi:hypothetical protein Patl1_31389 [Pistacia atlantica]|uniref:Uncharacterized protein n=1 Tax=Pistacia atlantica TaxID=434234 RepID=A0ACC1ANS2_9ROSI|nr:hypothetical protein Patl1_31389 [Pistacia atlantica]
MDSHTKIGSLDYTPASFPVMTWLAQQTRLSRPSKALFHHGYARSRGVSACVVTFTVGGLSVLNAIAGAYNENLPLAVVNNLEDAHELIDTAISTSLKESKPVYISISCNLPAILHPTFSREPSSICTFSQVIFQDLIEATAEFLNKAVKPVSVGGPKLRVGKALSTAFCAEIVESEDAYLFAGPIFNDYSSVGYSLLVKEEKAIILQPDRVVIVNGTAFGCVLMKDFLKALSKRLKRNTTAYDNYHRIYVPEGIALKWELKEALRKLKLPEGCGYEFQMQHGSIGWSVGATLGYVQAVPEKRVIACIGDGSFQAEGRQLKYKEKEETAKQGSQSISLQQNAAGLKVDLQSTKPTVDIPSAENMVEYDRGKGNIPTHELWSFCNSIPR